VFDQTSEDRLSTWAGLRASIENSTDPLKDVCEFWGAAPYIPYNRHVDPHHPKSWPTPWEIIVHNKYDDFTKAMMMGWTLRYSNRFKNSKIEIQVLVDKQKKTQYNVICVDSEWILNYIDNEPACIKNVPEAFYLENNIELETHR
jgi:hypothetical protein